MPTQKNQSKTVVPIIPAIQNGPSPLPRAVVHRLSRCQRPSRAAILLTEFRCPISLLFETRGADDFLTHRRSDASRSTVARLFQWDLRRPIGLIRRSAGKPSQRKCSSRTEACNDVRPHLSLPHSAGKARGISRVFRTARLGDRETQKGFRWAFALPPHAPSEEWLTISGWDAREDAETYNRHPDRNKTIVNAEDFFLEAPHATGYDDVIE